MTKEIIVARRCVACEKKYQESIFLDRKVAFLHCPVCRKEEKGRK